MTKGVTKTKTGITLSDGNLPNRKMALKVIDKGKKRSFQVTHRITKLHFNLEQMQELNEFIFQHVYQIEEDPREYPNPYKLTVAQVLRLLRENKDNDEYVLSILRAEYQDKYRYTITSWGRSWCRAHGYNWRSDVVNYRKR